MSALNIREHQALARTSASASRRLGMEKKIEDIRIHVDEPLKRRLEELAAIDDRSLSDYCRRALIKHVVMEDAGVRVSIEAQRSGEAANDGSDK